MSSEVFFILIVGMGAGWTVSWFQARNRREDLSRYLLHYRPEMMLEDEWIDEEEEEIPNVEDRVEREEEPQIRQLREEIQFWKRVNMACTGAAIVIFIWFFLAE